MPTLTIPRRKPVEVADFAEASRLYAEARDKSGQGASRFPEGAIIEGGEVIARLSYNAKVWAPGPWKSGAEPLFDPYSPEGPAPISDFTAGQRVIVVFNRGAADEYREPGAIEKNIDATCAPLRNMWSVRLDRGATIGVNGRAIDPAPVAPNEAFFGIRYGTEADMWLNDEGNIGSEMLAAIFDSAEAAQKFLDTRRLRPGFRPRLKVTPISTARIAEMAAEAQEYADSPPLPHGNHNAEWAARAEVLRGFLPLVAQSGAAA